MGQPPLRPRLYKSAHNCILNCSVLEGLHWIRTPLEDIPHHRPQQLRQWFNLEAEDVYLAIASLVVGIVHAGGAIMPVATDRMQQWARTDASLGLPWLRNPKNLILPILIDGGIPNIGEEDESGKTADEEAQIIWQEPVAQEKAKAKTETADALVTRKNGFQHGVGHLILVVAERTGIDVNFRISDSVPSYASPGIIRRIMRNTVRFSGWMGDQEPHFIKELYEDVPRQLYGTNACGMHVVLTGWAYLLGIKVNECWQPTEDHYREAMQLVNIALRGHGDAKLIEAWMFSSGFARPQSLYDRIKAYEDNELQIIMTAHTARMNVSTYDAFIEQACIDEISAAPPCDSSHTPPHLRDPMFRRFRTSQVKMTTTTTMTPRLQPRTRSPLLSNPLQAVALH